MKTLRDYIDLITQLHEAPDTVVPGGGSITNVDPNSAEGKAMIARSQAVQAGKSPDSAAPAPGQAATPAPAAAPAAAAPKTWNKGVLGKGMKGPEVSALQKKLGIADTGTYDAATIAAVQALQKKLGVAADGAYGPGTKAAHDKMPPEQAATPAPAAPVNQAAPGQPGFTTGATADMVDTGAAKGAANAAARSSTTTDPGQTSLNARVTTAIPDKPVDPTNPSGVGANASLTPDQAAVRKDILAQPTDAAGNTTDATGTIYKRDLDWMKRFGQNAPAQTAAPAQTPPAAPAQTPPAAPAQTPPAAPAQTPPAAPGETAGGASTARRVVPATGARAQQLQRQQAQNQMPESRDTPFQKQLNAMKRIAGLKDNGL